MIDVPALFHALFCRSACCIAAPSFPIPRRIEPHRAGNHSPFSCPETRNAKRTAFGALVLLVFAADRADCRILPALPAGKINVESHIQNDPDHGGYRGGKADPGQAGVGLNAHEIRHGKADEKGLDQPLDHDPKGLLVSVEVTDHTEQDGGGDGLRGETFQVFKAL